MERKTDSNEAEKCEQKPAFPVKEERFKELDEINKEVEQLTLVSENNNATTAQVFVRKECNNSLQYLLQCYETSSSDSDEDYDEPLQPRKETKVCSVTPNSTVNVKTEDTDECSDHSSSSSDDESSDSDSISESDSDSGSSSVAIFEESSSSVVSENDNDDEGVESDTEKEILSVVDEDRAPSSNSKGAKKKEMPIKAPGELDLKDLPPVPDLPLDIAQNQNGNEHFLHIGHIRSIVGVLVTIEALPNMPSFDIDTIFYVNNVMDGKKKAIGTVFDVIGPVTEPLYIIRYNKATDITAIGINVDMQVFCPPKSPYTHYVFVKELLKHKGSDASWIGDIEVPSDLMEFSDDEEEKRIKRTNTQNKRPHSVVSNNPPTTPTANPITPQSPSNSLERHRHYEKKMNRFNTLDSHIHHITDSKRSRAGAGRGRRHLFTGSKSGGSDWGAQSLELPPAFDPRVPPPGFWPSLGTQQANGLESAYGYNSSPSTFSFWTRFKEVAPNPTSLNPISTTEYLQYPNSSYSSPSTSNLTHLSSANSCSSNLNNNQNEKNSDKDLNLPKQ